MTKSFAKPRNPGPSTPKRRQMRGRSGSDALSNLADLSRTSPATVTQAKFQSMSDPLQMQPLEEEEELMQGKVIDGAQPVQAKTDGTAPSTGGLPGDLSTGIAALSGMDVSDVRVHRNSSKPAAVQAHAYAQGNDIHLGPGQDRHLAHEAWHVVQQRQGRVAPTTTLPTGQALNDDAGLEREADTMGQKALQRSRHSGQRGQR